MRSKFMERSEHKYVDQILPRTQNPLGAGFNSERRVMKILDFHNSCLH